MNQWKYDLLCKDSLQNFWERLDSWPSCFMTVVRDLLLVSIVFFLFFCHHGIYNRLRWFDVKKKISKKKGTFFSRALCQSLSLSLFVVVVVFLSVLLFFSHTLPLLHHPFLLSALSLSVFLSCSFSLINGSLYHHSWPGTKLSEKSANRFLLAQLQLKWTGAQFLSHVHTHMFTVLILFPALYQVYYIYAYRVVRW